MVSDGSLPCSGGSGRKIAACDAATVFPAAHADNPEATRQAALAAALAGRIAEAAATFDRAREAAIAMKAEDLSPLVELIGIAAAVAGAAIDAGHPGAGQGIIDWLVDTRAVAANALEPLVEAADSPAVPLALRSRLPLSEPDPSDPAIAAVGRAAFDAALGHARDWRLAKAVEAFRGLDGAGGCRPVLVNIGLICEWLARSAEAAEAWRTVARLADTPHDVAVEAIGRAIALEAEAEPELGPRVSFVGITAPLDAVVASESLAAVESRLRGEPCVEAAPIDAAAWTNAGTSAPRSAWWICEQRDGPPLVLASLLIFDRPAGTDRREGRAAEAVLRGFDADIVAARPVVERLLGCTFAPAVHEPGMPAVSPTAWLLAAQFHLPEGSQDGDEHRERAVRERFVAVWPDTPLPELQGRTPRQAITDPEGALRVEAVILEGEAAAAGPEVAAAWSGVRAAVGLPSPGTIVAREPLDEVSPLRWHLVAMESLPVEQLRGLFELARDAGFDAAALRAADVITARGDRLPR